MAKWLVWYPEYGHTFEDAREIEAFDAESAACEWAERDDQHSADYRIAQGNAAELHVRAADGGEVLRFSVIGEAVPWYSARRIASGEGA